MRASVPLLLLCFFPRHAHAMDWSDFPRSENVEDRRAGITEPELDPAVQAMLVKAGKLAQGGKFPFLCPALKAVAADAASLGAKLEKLPTLWKMKTDFDQQFAEKISASFYGPSYIFDACKGARDGMLKTIQASQQALLDQNGKLRDTHGERYWEAVRLMSDLEKVPEKAPSIGDRINSWMGQCPKQVDTYKKALVGYQKQVMLLREDYDGKYKGLGAEYEQIKQQDCGTAPATAKPKAKAKPKSR